MCSEKFIVVTASSMEFRLAAANCRKLHAQIQDDAAAASRHTIKVALSGYFDTAAASR